MASSIVVPDRQVIGSNPQEILNALSDLAAAAKADVEALQTSTASGDMKPSAVLATTSALAANTRTGNTLLANANGALGTLDGVDTSTLTPPWRLLVKNEATQANNGLYSVTSNGSAGAKWSMTRAGDADESAEVTPGMLVPVEQGSVNGDKIFQLDINGPVTVNTTALVFADFRGLATTAPADVTKAEAVVGTSTTVARSDHKHDVSTAAPATVSVGNAEGTATSLARSDHVHNNGNQTFELTLDGVGGTATKSTVISVTTNTRAIITLKTPGAGVSGTRYVATYTIGGAGVGAVTVTAKDSAAGDNTITTDTSVLVVTLVEAASV